MPRRKKKDKQPSYSFVAVELDEDGANWRDKHSRSSRSHAAYWGGPAKLAITHSPRQPDEQQDPVFFSTAGTAAESSVCTKLTPMSTKMQPAQGTATDEPLAAIATEDPSEAFPDLLTTMHIVDSIPFSTSGTALDPCHPPGSLNENFISRSLMSYRDDDTIFRSAGHLLSKARLLALTGNGDRMEVLRLKSHVIENVANRLKSAGCVLSPQCLVGIALLGSPVVCLMSQDLPKRLSVRQYINESARDDHLCCSSSARIAQHSLHERSFHWQAVCRILPSLKTEGMNVTNSKWVEYLHRFMTISLALEPEGLLSVTCRHPEPNKHTSGALTPSWMSPITSQWIDGSSTVGPMTPLDSLAGAVHAWLATFVDTTGHKTVLTASLLEARSLHQERLESLLTMVRTYDSEETAMYYCCVWACSVMMAAEKYGNSIQHAAKLIRVQPKLVRVLRLTNLAALWNQRKGLLLWVACVCHLATTGNCYPLLTTAIHAHFIQEIAKSDQYLEIVIIPLRRLKQFELICCGATT